MENIRKYSLHNGNCLEVMKNIQSESIDLILCDLPFGITSCKWDSIIPFEDLWKQYNRIIKKNGAIVLFSAQPFTTKLINSNLKHYRYSWYWIKDRATGHIFAKNQPMRKVEDINVFYKQKPLYIPQGLKKLDKTKIKKQTKTDNYDYVYKSLNLQKEIKSEFTNYPNNLLFFKKESKTVHPTQKPCDLLSYLIKTYTREGDIVLDNCMGGGSAGVACATTKRRFIGIELYNKYFKIAKERVEKAYKEN
ncbi:MAG: DNA-methyltransferase [Paraclostridium sordellii]